MSNDYFNSSGAPTYGSRGLSQVMDAQFDLVGVGFDKVPSLANMYTSGANYAVDTGAVNALAVAISSNVTALADGMEVVVKVKITQTAAATITVTGSTSFGAKSIFRYDGSALQAGDFVAGEFLELRYNASTGAFQMINPPAAAAGSGLPTTGGTMTGAINEAKGADIASAATINLTATTGNLVHVTGTTGITGITIPVGAQRTVIFDGVLTLTHSASLLLPGAANITTAANDRMVVRGDTAGAIGVSYTRTSGLVNEFKATDVASASTVDLSTVNGNLVHITGTTNITAITIPSGAERVVVFDGALTLTHNATTLILPGGLNIAAAAGDVAILRGDGTGNTRVTSYTRAIGASLKQVYTSTSQLDKTSDTTLATIPGFTANVVAAGTYKFTITAYTNSPTAGGVKFGFAGTATATSFVAAAQTTAGGTYNTQRVTTLASTLSDNNASGAITPIYGTFVVNAGGTFIIQFAQNSSNATPSSVLANSIFEVERIA